MKNKFIVFLLLIYICLCCTVSAGETADIVFCCNNEEITSLKQGSIYAKVSLSGFEEGYLTIVTLASKGDTAVDLSFNRLYVSSGISEYKGKPVTVTPEATSVRVFLWDENMSPLHSYAEIKYSDADIKIEGFCVTDSENRQTHYGYVDYESRKICVEQTVDLYTEFGKTSSPRFPKFYDLRSPDYISLKNAHASYTLNGEKYETDISLDINKPAQLAMTRRDGQTQIFDVILEKHIAGFAATFNRFCDTEPSFDSGDNCITAKNVIEKAQFYGYCYDGAELKAANTVAGSGGIEALQDKSGDIYFNLSYEYGAGGKEQNDGALKISKKGNTKAFAPYIYIDESGSGFGRDKFDISFDIMYSSFSGAGSLTMPMVKGYGGMNAVQLHMTERDSSSIDIRYAVKDNYTDDQAFWWYGKPIGVIKKNEWHNIRIIIDRDSIDAPVAVCLDNEIILKTNLKNTENISFADCVGSFFGFMSYSTVDCEFYLDNIHTTFSQRSDIADNIEVREALSRYERINDKGILDFLIRIYDPETGGFCFAPSAYDLPGYEGELEATATIMGCLPEMGLLPSDFKTNQIIPDGFIEKMIEFYQTRQSEKDGYWYDPLYGNSMIETKRERTSSKTIGGLKQLGAKPLYPTYLDRAAPRLMKPANSAMPEYFQTEEKYIAWMAAKNWTTETYKTGNEIVNSLTIAKALGYGDAAGRFILSKQNVRTGLWGVDSITSDSTNGALKLAAAIHELGFVYPNADKAIDSIIWYIDNETSPENICTIWNPIILINYIRLTYDNVFPDEIQIKIDEKLVSIIDKTYAFLLQWRTKDGGFKYYPKIPLAYYADVDAAAGLDGEGNIEGNEDSTIIGSFLMRNSIYNACAITPPPVWEKYQSYFWSEIKKKTESHKNAPKQYEEGERYSEDFENIFDVSELYRTWSFIMQGSRESICSDICNNANKCLKIPFAPTVMELGGNDRVKTNFKIPKNNVYTMQLSFLVDTDGAYPLYNISFGSDAVLLSIVKNSTAGGYGNDLSLVYRTDKNKSADKGQVLKSDIKRGRWYTLKVIYKPKDLLDTETSVYLDGQLLCNTTEYANGGFGGRYPADTVRSVKIDTYGRGCDTTLYIDDISAGSSEK